MKQKERNRFVKIGRDGSITLFLTLTLTLILSFFFSLLEAARVQGLGQTAWRSLLLEMESMCGEYQTDLWKDYRLLFLDGGNESGELDLKLLEGRRMEEDSLAQKSSGFYQIALRSLEISGHTLAADDAGAAFEKQASAAIQRQLAAGAADVLRKKFAEGAEMAEQGKDLESQWESAKDAMTKAEELEKRPQNAEGGPANASEAAGNALQSGSASKDSLGAPQKDLPDNPLDSVDLLKKSAILTVVVENPSEISGKSIPLEDTLQKRKRAQGNQSPTERGILEKVWFLQYLDKFFSCKTGAAKGGSEERALEYELEYCLAGKGSDQENLEKVVKELLLIREAGNFATIMQDGKKQALALDIATAAVGFTGIMPLISAVQIGILLAWSYIESILDVRRLLAGGKVPLVKKTTEWRSDISLGEEALAKKDEKAESESEGVTYREYLQMLLMLTREEILTYRAMDVVERNIRLKKENFRMDCQIHGLRLEATYTASPLFLSFISTGRVKKGTYHFYESRQYSYLD